MIALIDDHREVHGVEPICEVLPIAPSTYHEHVASQRDSSRLSVQAKRDEELKIEVWRAFEENFRVYGVRKVWRQLQREGFDIARCTVSRQMRKMGLEGAIRDKRVRTTVSDKAAPCPLDHVNRQFHAPRPHALWVSDFTYVATWTGFVYVAFVIDAYARRIVGWRVSRTAHAGFVLDALSRPCSIDGPSIAAGLCITAIEAANTSRSSTPRAWRRLASSPRSAVSGIPTTMLSQRRLTVSTKRRSSIGVGRGARSKPSSSRRRNGCTGSTTGGSWSQSATSRRPKLQRYYTMLEQPAMAA
jgi:hypothetical protein